MKTEISSVELYHLMKELKELEGGRLDKIYQKEELFLINIYLPGRGKKMLKIKFSSLIYITEFKENFPQTPPGFCKFLRKRLGNGIVREIRQKGFERIVEIKIETKDQVYVLIVELFSKGNMILSDENHRIVSSFKSRTWSTREIRGGLEYEYPPAQLNTAALSKEEFIEVLEESDKENLVKTLAIEFGLGGLFAEETCARAGVDKEKEKLVDKEAAKVYNSLQGLFSENIEANISEDQILPFELELFKSSEKEEFESFSKAIDSRLSDKIEERKEEKVKEKKNKALDKVKNVINQQERKIEGLKQSIDENQEKGEFIYAHYQEIKAILEDLKKAREKMSWSEIREKLKESNKVKNIDEKKGIITVDVQ